MRSTAFDGDGFDTGVFGIGTGWHGSDVVVNGNVEVDVSGATTVVGVLCTACLPLLLPHAANRSPITKTSMTVRRTITSLHRGRESRRHRYDRRTLSRCITTNRGANS